MVGIRGKAGVLAKIGGNLLAGLHHSRRKVKAVFGYGNAVMEFEFQLRDKVRPVGRVIARAARNLCDVLFAAAAHVYAAWCCVRQHFLPCMSCSSSHGAVLVSLRPQCHTCCRQAPASRVRQTSMCPRGACPQHPPRILSQCRLRSKRLQALAMRRQAACASCGSCSPSKSEVRDAWR